MNAPTLFDPPLTRRRDPQTSRDAAAKVWSGWPERIIECLAMYGPASDDRICIRLNVDVRRWPTVKSARSRVVHAEDPSKRLIVATSETENGQTIWAHVNHRQPLEAVEIRGDVL